MSLTQEDVIGSCPWCGRNEDCDESRNPFYVLEAATCRNSELVGMSDSIGTVTVGKPADIVAVDGDPLKDMETMNHVSFVMKDGKVYKK